MSSFLPIDYFFFSYFFKLQFISTAVFIDAGTWTVSDTVVITLHTLQYGN